MNRRSFFALTALGLLARRVPGLVPEPVYVWIQDTSLDLPVCPNGGDIRIDWSDSGILCWSG